MKLNGRVYKTIDGKSFDLRGLEGEEKRVLAEIERAYICHPEWTHFTNVWRAKVRELYHDLPPKKRTSTIVYLIAEDMEARLGVSQKYFRRPDYRDQLSHMIDQRFPSRYAFCHATGLDQGFVSRLLHKSTDISVGRLSRAMHRIGWELKLKRSVDRKLQSSTMKAGRTR
jgi:hypothetical protein